MIDPLSIWYVQSDKRNEDRVQENLAELRDSETDEVLIRVAHLEKELTTAAAQITSAWDEIHQAVASWSMMLSDTLPTPPTASVPRVAELGR